MAMTAFDHIGLHDQLIFFKKGNNTFSLTVSGPFPGQVYRRCLSLPSSRMFAQLSNLGNSPRIPRQFPIRYLPRLAV